MKVNYSRRLLSRPLWLASALAFLALMTIGCQSDNEGRTSENESNEPSTSFQKIQFLDCGSSVDWAQPEPVEIAQLVLSDPHWAGVSELPDWVWETYNKHVYVVLPSSQQPWALYSGLVPGEPVPWGPGNACGSPQDISPSKMLRLYLIGWRVLGARQQGNDVFATVGHTEKGYTGMNLYPLQDTAIDVIHVVDEQNQIVADCPLEDTWACH